MSRMTILPVVKAYPVVDHVSFSEAVCVAGITAAPPHKWVRLFPLDFRSLGFDKRFKKYAVISLEARKSRTDPRPETYTPVLDSVRLTGEHLDTDNGSRRRRMTYFDALMDESMCEIKRLQKTEKKSLGIFRPAEVFDLALDAVPADFAASQRAVIEQGSLLGGRAGDDRPTLEPLPVKARFRYRCADVRCKGKHEQSLIDWELGALYRSLQANGDDEATIFAKIRRKFFDQYCGPKYETCFIVGSMLKHPASFLVLGLVHPKRPAAQKKPQEPALF